MDKVGVMAAYSDPLCVCVVHCIWRHLYVKWNAKVSSLYCHWLMQEQGSRKQKFYWDRIIEFILWPDFYKFMLRLNRWHNSDNKKIIFSSKITFLGYMYNYLNVCGEVTILFFLQNDKGDFDYRYLFVQLDDYPRNTIIIEDNRYDNQMSFDKPFDTL